MKNIKSSFSLLALLSQILLATRFLDIPTFLTNKPYKYCRCKNSPNDYRYNRQMLQVDPVVLERISFSFWYFFLGYLVLKISLWERILLTERLHSSQTKRKCLNHKYVRFECRTVTDGVIYRNKYKIKEETADESPKEPRLFYICNAWEKM